MGPAGETIVVWREDHLLADPGTPSKVGAVTVETRDITNKSGVSHLLDWALALEVLDHNLSPGTHGNVLHLVWKHESSKTGATNPYVILGQRLAFTWILFQSDGDMVKALLARFPTDRSL